MPINIFNTDGDWPKIAWLCDESWSLPHQIDTLQDWLLQIGRNLETGNYTADIGFMIREDASGGGAVLSPEAMGIMSSIRMQLLLSEYPGDFPKSDKS